MQIPRFLYLFQCNSLKPTFDKILLACISELTASQQFADKENRADKIRSYIELHPDVTAADIARSFGITRQTASRYVKKGKGETD